MPVDYPTTSELAASLKSLSAEDRARLDLLLEGERVAAARERLIDFACYVDPLQSRWYRAPHLQKIAEHLERVERYVAGEDPPVGIPRLIVETPPRHWKSSLVSGKFPAWFLGRHPHRTVLLASHEVTLAEQFSRQTRDMVLGNPHYRTVFPKVKLKAGSRDAKEWALVGQTRSSLRAAGVGGTMTGRGGHLLLVDDPTAGLEQALSGAIQENEEQWYEGQWYNRREPRAAMVIIMQRWPGRDFVERRLLAEKERGADHWEILRLPALADKEEDPLGRKLGEPLWPDRWGNAFYPDTRANLLPWVWEAVWQQNPTMPEGTLIKRAWFEFVPHLPIGAAWHVRPWDCAFTEAQLTGDDPDFTATCLACAWNDLLYLGSPRLFRADLDKLPGEIIAAKMQEPAVRYGGGKAWVESAIAKAMANQGLAFERYAEPLDKLSRASAWINRAGIGRVILVGTPAEWEPFLAQWTGFPHAKHDDAVDCVSGAAQMLGLVFNAKEPPPPRHPSVYDTHPAFNMR